MSFFFKIQLFSRFDEDFEFIQEIGKGGFGRVLEAKHKLSDQNYAIKIIKLPVKDESQKKVSISSVSVCECWATYLQGEKAREMTEKTLEDPYTAFI